MAVENAAQAAGGLVDGLVHGDPPGVAVARLAQEGAFHPAGVGNRLPAGRALGAQPSRVGRVGLVTGDLDHPVAFDLHDDAAAHATIGTHAFYRSARHNLFPARNEKAPCRPPLDRGLHGAFVVGWGNRR
ncbi:hypothetical protein D3C76_1272710 [compost metagenome]